MHNICICKLKSGEEFIADVTVADDNILNLKNAAIAVPHPEKQGVMMLVPWNPTNFMDNNMFSCREEDFLFIKPCNEQIANAHIQSFSGIALPNTKSGLLTEGR